MGRSSGWNPGMLALCLMGVLVACVRAERGTVAGDPTKAQVAGVVQVPYRWVRSQRLIEVEVAGEGPYTFLVDTGVSGAAIDLDVARAVGIALPPSDSSTMSAGANAGDPIYQTWIVDLAVGDLRVDSLQAAALPLGVFGERLGEPLHGILGDGFLGERVTRFDDVERTLSFAPTLDAFPEDVAEAAWVTPMNISRTGEMPRMEVSFGDASFLATLDMGSSLGLEIFAPYAEELGLGHALDEWPTDTVVGGSLGTAIVYDGMLERVEIGPLVLTDVPTTISPARTDPDRKGNLGNRLWVGYVIVLDYPGDRMVFRR